MLYLLIALLVVIDQAVKLIIVRNVDVSEIIPVINGFFSITHVKNTGGAFSFLSDNGWGIYFLAAMSLFISIILIIIIFRLRNKEMFWIRLSEAVLCGGSIGNMIDRFARRSVVDFMMFDFGKYTFPVFNFADMCIVVGSLSLALFLLFDKRFMNSEEKSKESSETQDGESMKENADKSANISETVE